MLITSSFEDFLKKARPQWGRAESKGQRGQALFKIIFKCCLQAVLRISSKKPVPNGEIKNIVKIVVI